MDSHLRGNDKFRLLVIETDQATILRRAPVISSEVLMVARLASKARWESIVPTVSVAISVLELSKAP